jgi:hypothetical protein
MDFRAFSKPLCAMHMRRFTRLTNGFSKKVENHAYQVALHFMHHKFRQGPQDATRNAGDGSGDRGIADHVWTIEEMLDKVGCRNWRAESFSCHIYTGRGSIVRWLRIRKSNIDPGLRKTFERYGMVTMQVLLATNNTSFRHKGNLTTVQRVEDSLLAWLTEQYDRAERKETWLVSMEAAITVFVLAELVLSALPWFHVVPSNTH